MTPRARGYLPTLDGWRAIAILGVMIAHGTDALFAPGASSANPTLYGLTRFGAKGVDIFFGISGFLICARLLEEYERRGRIGLGGFYIRRFLRILPPYFVYLAVVAALAVAGVLAVTRAIVFNPPLALLWQSLLIPLVLAGTVLHPDGPAGRVLESRPARWIGRVSYSLYLWQSLFLVAFGLARPFGAFQRLPLNIVLLFGCAALSYYAVERPMIKLGHRLAPPTTEGRV